MLGKSHFIFRSVLELRAKFHKPAVKKCKDGDAILIIATLFLGDLFMTAPLISNLRVKYPGKKVVLVCREELEGVAYYLDVDYVVPSLKPSRHSINQIKKLNQNGSYSVYCIFSGRWLPAMVNLKVTEVFSFYEPANRWNHLITDEIPFPDRLTPAVEMPMLMLGGKHYDISSPPIDLWRPEGRQAIIHVGARSATRRMPLYLVAHLAKTLFDRKIRVIVSAGPNEFNRRRELKKLLTDGVYNNITFELGSKKLHELVKVVNSASLVVGIDTGVIHMSKMMGTPTLVVMGQSDPKIFGGDDLFSRSVHLGIDNLDCRDKKSFQGIQKDWINRCDRDSCLFSNTPCIEHVEMELIDRSINQLLKLSLNMPPSE